MRAIAWRLLPLIGLGYLVSYMDRVNISFAAPQMNAQLGFTASVYGFGGGLFFDKTLTRAVFGEATWKPSPLFDLTIGTRYEQENRDRTGGAGVFLIDYHKDFHAFLPKATVSFHANADLTLGATVGRGYNSGGAGLAG